ncbi:hypothetical protein QLX08_009302 [Tetragonisca angustula]|uniref:Uncharacterized protein n=1 Tax=Tetragonisca angustula TaxID=166442 RepID=A0AAW0ZGW1_9HYME
MRLFENAKTDADPQRFCKKYSDSKCDSRKFPERLRTRACNPDFKRNIEIHGSIQNKGGGNNWGSLISGSCRRIQEYMSLRMVACYVEVTC